MPTKKQLLERFGSEEAVSEHYRQMQKKSRENYSGNGGFRALSKEERIKAAKLGAQARWNKKEE